MSAIMSVAGRGLLWVSVMLCACAGAVQAQEKQSADDVARELSNPVGSLASMVFQGTWSQWGGSAPGIDDQSTSSFIFLPTLPFKVGPGNLILRPSFPLAAAPRPDGADGWTKARGLGDIALVANWGRVESSGILWSFGATSVFPTATNDMGKEQVQLGPAAILGLIKPWGVLGAFWQHWWGLNSDPDQEKVNVGTLQLFYWVGLGGGWQVGGSPVPTANYMAAKTEYTVPLNLGVAKTFLLGSMPLKTTLQGQYFLTRPDLAGPSWGMFFQITPVVKVPW